MSAHVFYDFGLRLYRNIVRHCESLLKKVCRCQSVRMFTSFRNSNQSVSLFYSLTYSLFYWNVEYSSLALPVYTHAHSHSLSTLRYACCYDEIKGNQDLETYYYADYLILTLPLTHSLTTHSSTYSLTHSSTYSLLTHSQVLSSMGAQSQSTQLKMRVSGSQ